MYYLSGGRVVASGSHEQLAKSDLQVVHQFMSGESDGPVPFHYPAPDLAEQLLSDEEP